MKQKFNYLTPTRCGSIAVVETTTNKLTSPLLRGLGGSTVHCAYANAALSTPPCSSHNFRNLADGEPTANRRRTDGRPTVELHVDDTLSIFGNPQNVKTSKLVSSVHQQAATLPNNAACSNNKRLCRSTTPSFKKVASLLLLFALSFGFSQQAWANEDNHTFYFSPKLCGLSWTSVKANCCKGDNGQIWEDATMTSTGTTFHGFAVYKVTVSDKYGGFDKIEFHNANGGWDDKVEGVTSWKTDVNGKICTGKDTWVDYVADSEQTFYFCPKCAGKDWTTPYANCNLGYNNWSNVQMTEVSGKTFCGQKVYQATVTTCAFDKIEFHKSSSDYSGKIELTNPSGVNGKLYNGSEWKTFSYDTEYTFYFATDWSAVYANCNLGYSIWKDLAMTNTGKTYNGKKIYSITVVAQGFNDIEFHKSQGGDWDSKVVGYSNSTTYKKDFTNALCTSANNWVAYTYDVTLTFDPKNGGATTNKVTLKGGSITAPSAPSKTGYTFQGWGTNKVAAGGTISNVQADATYDAQWKENTYQITFDANGGTSTMSEQTGLGCATAQTIKANEFTKTGYNFAGWATSSDGSVVYANQATVPALTKTDDNSTLALFAKWTPITYTVAFNANGGDADAPESINGTYDVNLSALPNYTGQKAGFTFGGWNDGTGTTYEVGATPKNLTAVQGATVILYAKWIENSQATIIMAVNNANGGTIDPAAGEYTKEVGSSFPISAEANTGYNFTGWEISNTAVVDFGVSSDDAHVSARKLDIQPATSESATNNLVVKSAGSATVTANFTAKTTPLKLWANDGSENYVEETATYGQNIQVTVPTRTGYDFSGYYTQASGGTQFIKTDGTFAKNVSNWITDYTWSSESSDVKELHAHWTAQYWTKDISKNYQDASASNGKYKATYDATSIEITTPLAPRTGYTLKGYAISNGGAKVANIDGTLIANVDGWTNAESKWINTNPGMLYAIWEEVLTTVSLSTNPVGVANILISGTINTSAQVGVTTNPAISTGASIDNTAFTFKDWTLTNCSIVSNKLVGDGVSAEGSAVANFSINSCKMRWSKTSSTFYDADGEPEMSYDIEKKAYYIDITPTANPIYFRFKMDEAEWSADWEKSDGNVVKTAVVNGTKLDCNQDVHTWTTRATVKYAGCSSYPIRVWFDSKNKKTWITADTETQWSLAGSDELGGWSTSQNVMTHASEGSVLWNVAVDLQANKEYEFKIVNRAAGEYYGCDYTIKSDYRTTTALSTSESKNVKIQTTVAGSYNFQWSTGTTKVTVTYPTSYKVTFGSNLACVDGEGKTINNQDIIEPGTQLVFTATDRTAAGYDFAGFFKDGSKTQPVTEGTVSDRTYTVTPTADIEVHAGYTPIVYNITYEVNGGQEVTEHLTYTVETATFNLPTPLFTGNAFQGWYDNSGFTGSKIEKITQGSKGDKTFYARWEAEGLYLNINTAGTGTPENWQQYKFDGTSYTITLPKNDTYTFSLREVKAGVDDKWYKNAQTWTETGQKEINTTSTDSKVTTLSAIDGDYTFTVNNAITPSQLTITYPSFSCNITTAYNVMPNEAFNVTIAPVATGFTPTYKLFVQKDNTGDWTEVTTHEDYVYTFTPTGAGTYIFKVRAYAGETEYLESAVSAPVTVASLNLEATIQTVPVNTQVMITPSTNLTGSYYVCYALTNKPEGSAKTDTDIQPVAESNKVTFSADIIGEYLITATLRDAACTVSGRDLASATITLTAIEQYKIYFKKAAEDWGNDAYVYFNPTWNDQSGVTNYQEGVQMTLVDGTTDVFWANVPNITPINGVVFGAKWFEKSTTFTECLVAYRQDFNKEYPYFVQDPTHKGDFGSCYSYGDGRWFRYATDKGYKLVVGTTEYPLTFPSEASIVPNAIDLQMEGNTESHLTLVNTQGNIFYLPAWLEISNHDNLVMTETANENKFLTAVAGTYTVTITFNSNVMPVISSTFPEVPAPSVTFTEQRFNGETELTFTGDGTQGNPYKFFLDEKMTLSISALPEVKGLMPRYKFGDGEASETNSYPLTTSSTEVQSITMEAYYEKGTVKSGSATKTVYYQGVAVPALHLSTTATNNEVNFDSWTGPTLSYRADNYTGSATITMNGASYQTLSGSSQDYTIAQPANPMYQEYVASATIDSREFKESLTLTVYRNVLVKMEDVNGAMGSKKVHLWRDGHGGGTTWPGIDFTTVFGNWKVFNMKYPVYDRWIVNDAETKQTETQSIDGTDTEICCKTGDSYAGTGDDAGKTLYKVIYNGVECPGHILVDDVPDQNVDKDATILVALPIHLMTGVQEEDITLEISVADDNKVTAIQSGMSVLVTGNAGGETNVTVKAYYHKGQSDHELITKTFKVTVTAMITIQAKYGDLGWTEGQEIYIHYLGKNIDNTIKMTWKSYDETTKTNSVSARIPLASDGNINFQIYAWDMNDNWKVTNDVTNVTASGCYTISDGGDGQRRAINRTSDYCWQDINYQVVINMNNGTQYVSNTVTNAGDKLSFFAPGKDEQGYKAGLVRLMNAGAQVAVIPAESFTTSGVYVADINTTLNGLTNINLYTGDYYIRTDAAGGWKDYKDAAHKFTEFAMLDGEIYDHYWVANYKLQNEQTKVNLQACVGNEYNDNLANKLVDGKGTDQYGDVTPDENGVNIRFAYNPATNYFDRAILTGSTTNEFLNIVSTTGNIYKTYEDETLSTELGESAAAEDSKFQDGSNWTYSKTIYTQINPTHTMGAMRIKAKAFNGDITDLLGYETDEVTGKPTTTPLTRTILATGTTDGIYELSVFYDFKTNRIVNAWSPLGDMQIDEPLVVNADIMFVRHEQNDAAHIILGENGSVKSLESVFFVLELDGKVDADQERHYWFSLPFDCKLSQVFGVEGYMSTWGIQYYDGKGRAENGFWVDSESYFKWFTEEDYKNPETTLHAGEGYVLSFDKSAATWKEYDGKALLRLYFPSQVKGFDLNHSTQLTKEYENQPCTITRDNRDKKDGNWKIIGSMAYNNSTPKTVSPSSETQGQTYADYPAFLYEYSEEAQEGKHFHAKDGKDYTYRAFFGYRVQFGGTITWLPQTESYPEQGIAARKHAMEGEKAHLTTRLELQKADGTKADQTFIALDINGTTGYDQNMDLGKITGSKQTTIYTTSEGADYAGNTLPMESQTVAVTVNTREAGTYTIAMPDGTEGVEMILIDSKTGNQTDLASGKYTVSLEKGNIADRFSIRINIRKTPTELNGAYNADGSKVLKYIDNERLNILLNGKLYNAIGADVK